jgi:predicted nucleotidyltransferase
VIAKFQIEVPKERIAEFCHRWRIQQFAFFGSVLRGDFRPDSDIDVLVTFAKSANPSVLDLIDMERELGQLFGRKVDLVERSAVEQSDNFIRRRHILESAEAVYGP